MRRIWSILKSGLAGLTILAVAALVLDRGGFLAVDNVLKVGRNADVARASQGSCVMPTTGTVSGLTLVGAINTCFAAILTANSGGSAPANGTGGAAMTGQLWLDTSTTPNSVRMFDGTSWNVISYQDAALSVWTPPVGGGTNTIASATTTDLWSIRQAYVSVTGTTTITALASASAVAGTMKVIRFTGALTLTHNATSLILPTGANITTANGDAAVVLALTTTNVAVVAYQKADGTSLSVSAAFASAVSLTGIISPTALSGTTNDWAPTSLATANLIRASASSAAIVTGMTAQGSGRVLLIHNVGSFAITFTNAGAGSSAANRFTFPYDVTLQPNDSIAVVYDTTTSRWRSWQTLAKAPTVQYLLSGTGATYTTPAGAIGLRVKFIGGGGGGGGSGGSDTDGSTGGTTTFNSITAIGGGGGKQGNSDGEAGVGGTGGAGAASLRLTGSAGVFGYKENGFRAIGGTGGAGFSGAGAGRGGLNAAGSAGAANTGAGGGGANDGSSTISGGGGGAGEYVELVIASPSATYTYTVGTAGTAGGGNQSGGAGGTGFILVEEFY